MSFLDKVKNMFLEEIDDEEPVKTETHHIKIPTPAKNEDDEIQDIEPKEVEEPKTETPIEIKKTTPTRSIPTFFDDDDEDDEVSRLAFCFVKPLRTFKFFRPE